MKAIVHIGTEKTGTTSIQKCLDKNGRKLRRAGFHVLRSAGRRNSRALASFCMSDDTPDDYFRDNNINTAEERKRFRQQLKQRLNREISSLPASIHTVVISSEHFHSRLRSEDEMSRFRNLLGQFFDEFKIVCYIREQVATGESWYSTTLKVGGTNSLTDFMQRCRPSNYYFNYQDSLAQWEKYYGAGSLDISLFSRQHFVNNDLLSDFAAKLDPALIGKLNTHFQTENESLSPSGQAMARALNITFPVISGSGEVSRVRDRCKKITYRLLRGQGQRLDNDTRLKIYESFRESNEQVRARYFPDLQELFPPPKSYEPEEVDLGRDFSRALNKIQRVFKWLGRGAVTGRHSVGFYCALGECIRDVLDCENTKASRLPGINVQLDVNDVQMLNICARRLSREADLSFKIMSIIAQAMPDDPGVKKQLKRYSQDSKNQGGDDFLVAYYVSEMPQEADKIQEYQQKFAKWVSRLDSRYGLPLSGVQEAQRFSPGAAHAESVSPPLSAFSVIQAGSLEEAISIVEECPNRDIGGTVDVMPIYQFHSPPT